MISSFFSFVIFQVVIVFVSLLFHYKNFCNYFFLFCFFPNREMKFLSEVIHIVMMVMVLMLSLLLRMMVIMMMMMMKKYSPSFAGVYRK